MPHTYPFPAIVGQEAMKRALLLNAVDPSIGGALIRGEKGTAKSTAVRALPALLPKLQVVEGCPCRCAPEDPATACPWCADRAAAGAPRRIVTQPVPVVELPLAATEDRVAGSFDLEAAIRRGVRQFEPGLLAAANRGILYVDEVNLLPDHLVDSMLDAAATGLHRVEREGVSVTHPARFLLVGTMNPEEGELRPQLLDRFGLAAEVVTPRDPAERATIVRRRIAFDADPEAFAAIWAAEEGQLRADVLTARSLLPSVRLDDRLLDLIAQVCLAYAVDGLRADIVIYKAAAALSALHGRAMVNAADVGAAAELALPHRRRRQPFDEHGFDRTLLDRLLEEFARRTGSANGAQGGRRGSEQGGEDPTGSQHSGSESEGGAGSDQSAPGVTGGNASGEGEHEPARAHLTGERPEQRIDPAAVALSHDMTDAAGRRGQKASLPARSPAGRTRRRTSQGHYVCSRIPRARPASLAFDAMLRAAAPYQTIRAAEAPGGAAAVLLRPEDIREHVYEGCGGHVLLFAVDASGSMAAHRRMALAKGAVRALLVDAYRRRDRVGMIAFRGAAAQLVLPPTNSVALADRRLIALPTGGRTPLASALDLARRTLSRHRRRDAGGVPVLILVSDGQANVAAHGGDPWEEALRAAARVRQERVAALVIDTDTGGAGLGFCGALGEALGAPWVRIPQTSDGALLAAVQRVAATAGGWC